MCWWFRLSRLFIVVAGKSSTMSCVVYDCCLLALGIFQSVESDGKWPLIVVVDFLRNGIVWHQTVPVMVACG